MISFLKKFIDFRVGLYGALFMGVIVWCVNYFSTRELPGSFTAALKQAGYTLIFGGMIMRSCENFAVRIKTTWIAISLAIIIPSFIAVSLTLGVHSLRGTPRPVASTIPTAILIIPSTMVWSGMKRKRSKIICFSNKYSKPDQEKK